MLRSRRGAVQCNASQGAKAVNPRTASLKALLKRPGILKGPCCHDGLSARLIEKAGFEFAFMSGFCTAGARLGAPDTGLITYSEMVDTGRNIHEATRGIPIIGDGDTGYGNALNVKRTVRGYAQAGFAGILIEDQVAPKSCGHVRGKRVTSREEAVSRIKAAVDAREEGADILILARTDARQAHSMEEALWRVAAYADAGADILFIDALESEEEMRRFCWAGGAAARVPKMANMLEGGGKTPIMTPRQLEDLGFKLVAYPLSLLGVSIRAMETALQDLKQGVVPGPDQLPSFEDIQTAVGFPEYFKEESRYAISLPSSTTVPPSTSTTRSSEPTSSKQPTDGSNSGLRGARSPEEPSRQAAAAPSSASTEPHTAPSSEHKPEQAKTEAAPPSGQATSGSPTSSPAGSASSSSSSASSSSASAGSAGSISTGQGGQDRDATGAPVVEPDMVFDSWNAATEPNQMVMLSGRNKDDQGSGGGQQSTQMPRYFKVLITEQGTGVVKLETRIPATFLGGLTAIVPAFAGINIESIIQRAMRERTSNEPGGALVTLPSGQDLLQIFLEF